MNSINDYRYKRAKERVEAIKGFYGNALAYCIVISVLAYINYMTTSFVWIVFPALGWGIGLLAHGLQVFGHLPFLGKDWEQRKIKEYMNSDSF